ncbi:hypothetical protein ES319_D02G025800v1 [Gossypium barbadense]|uniref:Methanethiol oxidase n=2 Tax=Gossypium TaxID=3633 RepID=A0A5J5S9L4_GOSBA|nr:hypothetical protein ES319_D02G025800v1 [Gossypium barbadense]PPD80698.1 hypothetical protein GOBAR_DD22362 [Gossypium barbadense]TYH82025.1 hypothetical protein ES332_D02G028500v1 [Gossypium tomentosum]
MGEEVGCCKRTGPGYGTPLEAMSGPKEALMYVTCVYNGTGREKPDFLATVDVDPNSPTYSKVIHRLSLPYIGDELHHTGWNACSSCHGDPSSNRRFLILPSLLSGRIYVIDTQKNHKAPSLHKVVEPEHIIEKTGLAYPHTSHCLANGDIIISFLGDKDGNAQGNGFLLLDSQFNIKGRWEKPGRKAEFSYDFWYQPRHKTMICSSFGAPLAFTQGFNLKHVEDGFYGRQLFVYDWPDGGLKQTLDLGDNGLISGEIRFLHDPTKDTGYVECVLSSNVVRFFKTQDGSSWSHEVAISVKPSKVQNWILPEMPGLIIGLLISLDDRFLYFVNWFHGDVRQYNIEDPKNPILVGQVYVGGLLQKGSPITAVTEDGKTWQADVPKIQGHSLRGGPHMTQLSLDGKRLYVTNSLFSTWDRQFYPDVIEKGSHMIQIDVDIENGGLKINPDFFVDFGAEPDGPCLAHEMRYPGGDCTSDIWI